MCTNLRRQSKGNTILFLFFIVFFLHIRFEQQGGTRTPELKKSFHVTFSRNIEVSALERAPSVRSETHNDQQWKQELLGFFMFLFFSTPVPFAHHATGERVKQKHLPSRSETGLYEIKKWCGFDMQTLRVYSIFAFHIQIQVYIALHSIHSASWGQHLSFSFTVPILRRCPCVLSSKHFITYLSTHD